MGKMLKNKQKLDLYKKIFDNIGGKIGDRQNNIIKMLKIKGKIGSCINLNIVEFKGLRHKMSKTGHICINVNIVEFKRRS